MDPASDLLRVALERVTAEDVAAIVAEARAEARTRVRAILIEALTDAMLEGVRGELEPVAEEQQIAPRETEPAPARREQQPSAELGWYVYGVVGDDTRLPPVTVPGASLTTVQEGPVAAIVSRVPLQEFGEAELRSNLADMDWVERTARVHEAVLDQACRQATVIPMRMCTVYRTEGGVREMLRREARALQEALAHLEGKAEWGVKAYADPSRREQRDESQAPLDQGEQRGAAYMDRKRRDRDDADRLAQELEEACTEIHAELCGVADDALLAPPQRPEASGHPGQMLLNGVYLVEDDASEAFLERVRALQAEWAPLGLELEQTGPWPAYNFVPGTIGAAW